MEQNQHNNKEIVFTGFDEVRSKLNDFFTKPILRVLMIKGPWGSGKSYFLRDYISKSAPPSSHGRLLPKWISYASVLGCSSIQQLEERVSACLQPTKLWNRIGSGGVINVARHIFFALCLRFLGQTFASPLSSIIWQFTKSRELLIIIDDLERGQDDLPTKDVLGFASNMAENSRAALKVILICNTAKLSKSGADELSQMREKVVHSELYFNPSPKELVSTFFVHKEQAETMLECLSTIEEGNIRILCRVGADLTEIIRLFESQGASLSIRDKDEIVRLCVFYYRAGCAVGPDWFHTAWQKAYDLDGDGGKKKSKDPVHELLVKLKVKWSDWGPFVAQWLNLGQVDEKQMHKALTRVRNTNWQSEYQQRSEEAYSKFNSNFRSTDFDEVLAPIIKLLDDYAEQLSKESLAQHIKALRDLSVSPDPWILKHVRSWIPKMDFNLCSEYLAWLSDGEAKALVQDRLGSLSSARDIKETIWKIVDDSGWNQGDMEFLANIDAQEYKTWLESEGDPDTLQTLRAFFRFYSPSGGEPKDEACRRISAAIQLMTQTNPLHQVRATVFDLLTAAESMPTPPNHDDQTD